MNDQQSLDKAYVDWHTGGMLRKSAPMIFVCLWATGFIGARLGLPYSEAGTFLSLRFALAFVILTLVVQIARAPWPEPKTAVQLIIVGMLIHGLYLGAIFWVIDFGMPAGVSAIVVGLQPLVVAFLAAAWLGEKITPHHWFGLVLGTFGVFLVLFPKLDITDSGVTATTILVALFGMLSASLGTVLQKKFGSTMDLRSGTALQYLGAFIPVFILALVSETGEIDWTIEMSIAMVWSIVVLSFGAIFLLMWLIREGSVAKVASLFFLVPSVAAVMAYFLFGEKLILLQVFGMVLCAVAVALASLAQNKDQSTKSNEMVSGK